MKDLCEFVARTLNVPPAEVNEETGPLTLAKWDSFNHIHLMVALEEAYGIDIAPEEVVSLLSVGDIAALLQHKGVKVS